MKRAVAAVAAVILGACALPQARPKPMARVAVEVLRGAALRAGGPVGASERVEVLIDATSSMAAAAQAGPSRLAAARSLVGRVVRSLPSERAIGLRMLHGSEDGRCTATTSRFESGAGEDRAPLLEPLAALAPAGEASLAGAIDELALGLSAGGGSGSLRLVVLSDLSGDCGGSLCRALAGVAARGARVELVMFGDVPVPDCVDDLEIAGAWPFAAAAEVPFHVEGEGTAAPANVGVVGGGAVAVPPGSVRIVVDLAPPEVFGPVELAPGSEGRLRILDFPALEPPVREVSWDVEAAVVGDGEGAARDGP